MARRAVRPGEERRWAATMQAQSLRERAGEAGAVPAMPPSGVLTADEVRALMRRSRTLAATNWSDFGATIRVLQRHNKLLRERFGVEWADAASVVWSEAHRRGASAVALARVLAAGLRADAAGGRHE